MNTGLGVAVVVVVIVSLALRASVKIARDYQRFVVFRLGRSLGARGPGVVFLIPITNRAVRVDLREAFLEIPAQTCITRVNAPISIDFLIYWKVFDAALTVIQVGNFAGAAQGIATTALRAVIGNLSLDDVLAKRDQINREMRAKLDEVTERWGVKVTTIEIREITAPKDVLDAMTRQMSAERTRRALVTEAEGTKQAAITIAEGEKQAAILKAEGDRQAAILRAEGFSLALDKIQHRQDPGHHYDEPPVPGGPESPRGWSCHEGRVSDRVYPVAPAVRQSRRPVHYAPSAGAVAFCPRGPNLFILV